ncbi:DEAD/DEAH box helicase [Adhaeretor mobilis]|uniref:ATP-dependent helicase HepA n=1 Tax=Adhaeretor mobilis TaxID=1930276 RepID=A0A517N033_9BACT|nr:DEAD/DEAH box helicase [Adhaeretor mobilis]QDT00486.1 ATP-dependent helicase HepA [Adhaeretor mobilis]
MLTIQPFDESLSITRPSSFQIDCRLANPEVIGMRIEPLAARLKGQLFAEGADIARQLAMRDAEAARLGPKQPRSLTQSMGDGRRTPSRPGTQSARIQPPRDVVKWSDRLGYLLQPPLENLLAARSLDFPFTPFPYQLDGIAYLYPRHEAVLADEMGLGKTMQAVVTLRLLAHQGLMRRTLLVCPKPLVSNWRREFAQWAPEMPVTVIEGNSEERRWLWKNAKSGVLIANYELVVRDRQLAAAVNPSYDVMVIDESQRIKNRNGATNHAICSIPRARSWALTGTPIENSVEDLVGIFEFVSPGRLRPQMKVPSVRAAVSDHVLRRTKDNVLTELPPKLVRDADVALSPEQYEAYRAAEDDGVVALNDLGAQLTIQHVFELVLRLKQICNFDPVTGASTKFDRLEADLEECAASGRKAIVFSQWVNTIEKLTAKLGRFSPLEYHGKVPSKKRDGIIEQFRDDPNSSVLLMSYGAGSVGLNLQFSQYVFLFDRWWNPAVEDQAINRAHRIGAAGPVTVTRFLATGTIEERINVVLEEKRELFAQVFNDDADQPSEPRSGRNGLSREEIFGLFPLNFPNAA